MFEQAEFAWQQINRAVPALGGSLNEIKLEWAYTEHRFAAFLAARVRMDRAAPGSSTPEKSCQILSPLVRNAD